MTRPEPAQIGAFVPAPELAAWIKGTFIVPFSPLHNPEHEHLTDARIGALWTDIEQVKQQRTVLATAEIPNPKGSKWQVERAHFQLREWFGFDPDFVLTFSTKLTTFDDVSFCAIVEHELCHCAQAIDEYGAPKFNKEGEPKFAIRGHDVEEFVSVVARYGLTSASSDVKRLVEVAQKKPLIARAQIAGACGTCLKLVSHGS